MKRLFLFILTELSERCRGDGPESKQRSFHIPTGRGTGCPPASIINPSHGSRRILLFSTPDRGSGVARLAHTTRVGRHSLPAGVLLSVVLSRSRAHNSAGRGRRGFSWRWQSHRGCDRDRGKREA